MYVIGTTFFRVVSVAWRYVRYALYARRSYRTGSYRLDIFIVLILIINQLIWFCIFSSTGRDQSSLCDTLLTVCLSVRLSVRLPVRPSVCKQLLLSHLLWGYLSQRLDYGLSLLALWCSRASAILIMILSRGAHKGKWPFSRCKSCSRIFSYTIYLRHLVIVSICWQGGIDVHLWFCGVLSFRGSVRAAVSFPYTRL